MAGGSEQGQEIGRQRGGMREDAREGSKGFERLVCHFRDHGHYYMDNGTTLHDFTCGSDMIKFIF